MSRTSTVRDRRAGDPPMLDRCHLEGRSVEVAPRLLGVLLAVGDRVGRIVEVEAYGGEDDPASHAFRGSTPRNASMFARAGTLYCYRSYGIHTCANVVTGPEGRGEAVLLRAVEPVEGVEAMRRARPAAKRDRDLANGPGKLCDALGITLEHDGVDLCDPRSAVRLVMPPQGALPAAHTSGPRVGISKAVERPWRLWVDGSPFVSPHRHPVGR